MEVRPLKKEEQKYLYSQSQQIGSQTGNIGWLRGDFGPTGTEFWTTWFEGVSKDLNVPAFSNALDYVVNCLREPGDVLSDRKALSKYAHEHPDCKIAGRYTDEIGLRIDEGEYAILLRASPVRGDYNFYLNCYVAPFLDSHIEKAKEGIRFPSATELRDYFKVQDGESITISYADGRPPVQRTVRYIDPSHMELDHDIFHVYQFADLMKSIGATYLPTAPQELPEKCYTLLPSSGECILINRGESGYIKRSGIDERDAIFRNNDRGISRQQESAMLTGSMFGWDVPGADPNNYNMYGNPDPDKMQALTKTEDTERTSGHACPEVDTYAELAGGETYSDRSKIESSYDLTSPSLKEELSQPPVDHGLEQPATEQSTDRDVDR